MAIKADAQLPYPFQGQEKEESTRKKERRKQREMMLFEVANLLFLVLAAQAHQYVEPPPSPCTCPVEWESFNIVRLGSINMRSTSTQSFVIPTAVPSTAKEVLVYVYTYMGYSVERDAHLKIYTESSPTRRFEKYLAIKTYKQDAYATASDNMFFPMPSNRRVYVSLSRALTGNVLGYINVIGYR